MGTNYKCGCRSSLGRWYLCEYHEKELEGDLKIREMLSNNTS